MLYKKMFKLNTNGSTQVWEIHHNTNSHWSVSGKLGGKMIIGSPTMVEPKQKRTLAEQVISECDSKVNKKRDKKYVDDVNDIHGADSNLVGYSAMLAHSYDKQKKKIKFPCTVQPKLDGTRCLSTIDGMFTRSRKQYTSCPHIQAELDDFFKANPTAKLDGEFYTAEFKEDFEQICKAVKRTAEHSTPKDIEFQKKIQYWVYDSPCIDGLTEVDSFVSRQNALALKLKDYKYIKVVDTVHNVADEAEIVKLKEQYIQDGFEGAMVRNSASPYEGKRSYNLLKLKDFQDAEFEIVKVTEGKGRLAGCAGNFTVKMDDGKEFDVKLDGSNDRLRYLFTHQDEVIGKMATVRFQNLSGYGIPRFAVMKAIRGLKNRSDWV